MFQTCQHFTMKNKKGFKLLYLLYDNLDHVRNGLAISTGDNDQVKPAGKDYVNVKPV